MATHYLSIAGNLRSTYNEVLLALLIPSITHDATAQLLNPAYRICPQG